VIKHVDIVTATDTTLFTPSAGRRFRVVGFHLVAAGDQTIIWKHATTAFGDAWTFIKGVPQTVVQNGMDRVALMEGGSDEALVLTSSTTAQLSGWVEIDHL
jgi:hypothetical protein